MDKAGSAVLIVTAHPDDEVLGAGGTLARHAANGDKVHIVFLADGVRARGEDKAAVERRAQAARSAASRLGAKEPQFLGFPDNRLDRIDLLDITQAVERAIRAIGPSTVYTHHAGDLNIDHAICHRVVLTACRPLPGSEVRRIYAMEVPSSTEWASPAPHNAFVPTRFVDIAAVQEIKRRALEAYSEEMRPFPHPRSFEAIAALAKWRGATAGLAAAEAFMVQAIEIGGRLVGPGQAPYIVAELSANHGGSIDRALAVMEAAKAAGADAIKLQTYTADTITIDHDGPDFRIKGGLWDGRRLYELYAEAHTPWEWHDALFAKGRELGVPVFSTPFDETAVAFLKKYDPPAYKIASFEMIDLPLVQCVATTRKPVIMSTGMATPDEIAESVGAFRAAGGRDLVLLHCVSGYPTPDEQSNLRRIPELAKQFRCPVGLSDHTLGTEVAIASVALGACLIEKHFTLRRADGGPDAAFSLEPDQLRALVDGAKTVFHALGTGAPARAAVEKESLAFRRSLYVVADVGAGEPFTTKNVRIIRPGYGLAPRELPKLLGRKARRKLSRGTALTWDAVE
jgi:N-acetylneuraminate synthase